MSKRGAERSGKSATGSGAAAPAKAVGSRAPTETDPARQRVPGPPLTRFWPRLGLSALTVALLTLAYAPAGQFYLAWVGLVPWLILLAECRSKKAAFWWSYLIGVGLFGVTMGWLAAVTLPGAIGLVAYLALYFPVAALVIRGAGWLRTGVPDATLAVLAAARVGQGKDASIVSDAPPAGGAGKATLALLGIPMAWVALEWLRGTLFTGLPWLFIGHTQSPALVLCQTADFASVYGVGFWVAMINTLLVLAFVHRGTMRRLIVPALVTVAATAGVLAYGVWRMNQATSSPGPTVLLVQPNVPQNAVGGKGASFQELIAFHLGRTTAALQKLKAEGRPVDLVAWSETMMPPMGDDLFFKLTSATKTYTDSAGKEYDYRGVRSLVLDLAKQHAVNILVGCVTWEPVPDGKGGAQTDPGGKSVVVNRFNSAVLVERNGTQYPNRYDKIHLVPFGEFIPFKHTVPFLHRFFNMFNPYGGDYYSLQTGRGFTQFPLDLAGARTVKFVTPICFEDVDSALVAQMFRPDGGGAAKRADAIVNLTNDGWFRAGQMAQHLQIAVFRSIENRVPTARAVNTGVSAFVDPVGRVYGALPTGQEGDTVGQLVLDSRTTFYTLYGDVFIYACAAGTGVVALASFTRAWRAGRRIRKNSGA